MPITATFPSITFPHRGIQTKDVFVLAQETAQDLLAGDLTTNLNTFKAEANALEINVNAKEASAVAASASSIMASNFQGTWVNQLTIVGQSWEYAGVVYGVLIAGTASPITTPSNWIALTTSQSIKNTPSGNISATTVQDAINQLDSLRTAKNYIINGNFDIWDYGTSGTTSVGVATYTANRWIISSTGVGAPWSKQATDKSGQYGLQVASTAGLTGVTFIQRIESIMGRCASGKAITIQYKIYSPDSRTITYSSKTADVIDVFSVITQKHTGTFNVVAGWNTGSFTISSLDATSYRGFDIEFQCGALTSGNLAIAQMKLEEGSVATSWSPYNSEFGGEVQACARYLPVFEGNVPIHFTSNAGGWSSCVFKEKSRVPPSGFTYTVGGTIYHGATLTSAITAIGYNGASVDVGMIAIGGTGTPFTVGQAGSATIPKLIWAGCEL